MLLTRFDRCGGFSLQFLQRPLSKNPALISCRTFVQLVSGNIYNNTESDATIDAL